MEEHSNLQYIRTEQRETIYEAWNRGIRAARGKYITSANTDDRLRPDALERLARELDDHPEVALVYGDFFITNTENQEFDKHIRTGYSLKPEYTPEIMLDGCHMGPQPMWRRSLHDELGWFDGSLASAGDYEFWCRIAQRYPMRHVPEFLGLYLHNTAGICNSNTQRGAAETARVKEKYAASFPTPPPGLPRGFFYREIVAPGRYVNIGMVTYNRLEFTRQAIQAVLQYTDFPYVLTVVDNASQDGTREYLTELRRQGIINRLILLDDNIGVARASNLAWLAQPEAQFYLKLDNDIVIQKPHWLESMVQAVERIPKLGAVGYNFEPVSYPVQKINGVSLRLKERGIMGGACFLVPQRVQRQFGYWCEDYGLYGEEDGDYCTRLALGGLGFAYLEDENIGIHLPGGKAGFIDEKTKCAEDRDELKKHFEYRSWKDARRQDLQKQGGLLPVNVAAYHQNVRSLYVTRGAFLGKISDDLQVFEREECLAVMSLSGALNKTDKQRLREWARGQAIDIESIETTEENGRTVLLVPKRSPAATPGNKALQLTAPALRANQQPEYLEMNRIWKGSEKAETAPAPAAQTFQEAAVSVSQATAVATLKGRSVPLVSFIIPTFNKLPFTQACLAALAGTLQETATEIIVVDNGSTDGTFDFLRAEETMGRLRLLVNARNLGFARACNQGAAEAAGRYLLFLNNDTEATPGWLEALLAAARETDAGVIGAKLLYPDGRVQHAGIEFVNGLPDHPNRFASAATPEVNRRRELDMVTGACLFVAKALFLEIGGFDEVFRNGVEDIDLCLRARMAGRKVLYEPRCVVYHREGQSQGRFDHVTENLKMFFARWGNQLGTDKRLILPANPRVIRSEKSLLTEIVKIDWIGSFLDHGSLSHVNRELTGALAARPEMRLNRLSTAATGADIGSSEHASLAASLVSKPSRDAVVTVRHSWPPDWQRPHRGKLVVMQPWEFGALPEAWVKDLEKVDECWVYSEYVRRVYVESGVSAEKVFVVPLGIDPEKFHPEALRLELPTRKKFKFLFVGGTIGRKGPDVLLNAFLETFTAQDDVCLVIKDFGGRSVYAGQTLEAQVRAAQARPGAPEIVYLDQELPSDALPGLYTACDCLVHPYRGEGFGLPVLEAMACGLPVVVTGGGATDDFATDAYAYRLPASRCFIGDAISGMKLVRPGWLLEPDRKALGERMKWMPAHADDAKTLGRAASQHVRQEWTWQRAAQTAAARLQALQARSEPHGKSVGAPKPNGVAIALPPCALLGHLGRARELLGRKNARQAWEDTLGAIEIRPFHPEAYLLLAEIAQGQGDGQTARLCAEHARYLAPDWKPVRQFLNRRLKGNSRPPWLVLPETIGNAEAAGKKKSSPQIAPAAARLSVFLIARNEEKFIGQCLASVRGLADQIVVVDTGSTDRTVEIAREHGAEVYTFTWADDFSAARNAALGHVTGDWVLMLDADEELVPEGHAKIREHMQEASVIAWRLPLLDVGREADGVSYVPRLFRNAPALFYVGRIHEQVFSSVEVRRAEWGLENRVGEATLRHHGYTPEMMRDRKKHERNLRLLERAIEEIPGDPHLLMSLGQTLARCGREAEALDRFDQAFEALAQTPPAQVTPELREMLLSQCCTQFLSSKRFPEIVRMLTAPVANVAPGLNASLHFALGLACLELGRFGEAAEQMQFCLAKRQQRAFCPANPDIFTAAPAHCLALAQMQLGDVAAAEKAFQAALKEKGHGEQARFDYARFLFGQNRPVEALQCLHQAVREHAQNAALWRLGGQIALSQPAFLEVAGDWTAESVQHFPDDHAIVSQRAEALLLSQQTAPARPLWERIWNAERQPPALAAVIFCDLVNGSLKPATFSTTDRVSIGRAFLEWYRKSIAVGARALILQVNNRLGELRLVLPEAASTLEQVVTEAERSQAPETCSTRSN
jgi:GT2 family glycosyltransferase/Tfp pilus assembly protein PilF